MKRLVFTFAAVMGLSGCATPSLTFIPKEPLPAYVSPIYYEDKSCADLQHMQRVFGDTVRTLRVYIEQSSRNWDKPVGNNLSTLEQRGLSIQRTQTVFDVYTLAWGNYEAVMKVAGDEQCGLTDTYNLTPWYQVRR